MSKVEIAYLGPAGTYSHLVAMKRFGRKAYFVPFPSITEVCNHVARHPSSPGIVPIENSSGGAIHETVDILITHNPKVHIVEELSLAVRLALLGRRGERIKTLYSHFAPLEHCSHWIGRNLPRVVKQSVASTAVAAQRVVAEPSSAALGSRNLASIYGLDVLRYPVQADIPNLTIFLCIAARPAEPKSGPHRKISLVAHLPNKPGSLCSFLETFRNESVNLSRLISRPIRGSPREYAFLVDVEGSPTQPNVGRAMSAARSTCVSLRTAGCFVCRAPYKS